MFGVVPKTLWQKRIQPDADNRIVLGLNSAVVRTGQAHGGDRDRHRQQADAEDAGIFENQELLPAVVCGRGRRSGRGGLS